MQIHQIKRKTKEKKKIQVGRGGKRGKTSGRGTKGQNARAGRKKYPEIREMIKKLPKKRGYRFNSYRKDFFVLNLQDLNKLEVLENITPEFLVKSGLVEKQKGKIPLIKILSRGDLAKKIVISGCLFSQKAKEKIEKMGGKIE